MKTNLSLALKNFTDLARQWNKNKFGNIFARKKRVLARINGAQKALCNGLNHFLIQLEKELIVEYNMILCQEEEFWALKSHVNWAINGDRNTAFFHVSTLVRRHKTKIRRIKNAVGEWITNEEEIKSSILSDYQQLFKTELPYSLWDSEVKNFSCTFLSEDERINLASLVSEEEIMRGL